MSAAPELAPCPFCGSEASILQIDEENAVAIECSGCGASSCKSLHLKDDATPVVVEAWNRRASILPALRAVRDQCDAIAGEQLSALGWGEIYTGLNIIDLDDAALLELAGVPGAMSLDQATSAGSAPASKRSVRNCSRCGDNHEPIAIKQMSRPIDTYDHWGTCPTTGDPILFDLNPSEEEIERVTRETERIVGEVEASAPSPLDIYSPWHEKRAHEQVAAPAERHSHNFGNVCVTCRRQSFEEAARMVLNERIGASMVDQSYKIGWNSACRDIAAQLEAKAKEHG